MVFIVYIIVFALLMSVDINVMMSFDLYGTCRHCVGLCPIRSSMDVIVTQITTVVFGNVATVTLQLLLHHARRYIGCKWPMDKMCSKHEKHCFSHDLQEIFKLRNFGKFPKKKCFVRICFFHRIFFLAKMFFLTIFLQRIFYCFQDHYTVLK